MTSTPQERPPYRWALGTFAVVFAIYLATLAPTTAFWDTSEYIAAAKVLGIPHPPGNPLFIIMAHAFGLLPLAASYAERINLFAATTSAAAAGLWFLVAERWLRGIVTHRWARYAAAFGGVLVGATSWSVWNQSTVNEKVYTVSLFSIALVMWLVVRWGDDEPGPHRDRWLVLIAYVLALSSTNHLMGMLAVPALVVYVLWTDWRVVTRPTVLVGIVIAGLVGISLNYLWLPMRAGQYPPINEGEPVGFFSQALQDVLNRVQYGKPRLTERQASFPGQLANFWQYYSWQFARDWGRLSGVATAIFTVLGLSGLWALWKSDKRAGLAGLALLGTLSLGLVFYMNFKYGFSQYPDQPSLPREVRERDYFFIGSFAVYGAFVACGLGALMQSIVDGLRDRGTLGQRWAAASPVLALAFIPLAGNHATASRADETMARDFAYDMLNSVEPYGILITAGDNDTFPLWYAQEVEGVRRDVVVANTSLLNTDWYTRQLIRRPVYEYDAAKGPAIYRGRAWPRPASSPIKMTMEQADSVPPYIQIDKPMTFQGGPIKAIIDPQRLSIPNVLQRADIFVLRMIADSFGDRPIYLSRTSAGYGSELGIGSYMLTQGLATKLFIPPVAPNKDTLLVSGAGWVDVARTKVLWDSVFVGHRSLSTRHDWVDRPSVGIPYLYVATGLMLSEVLQATGDSVAGTRVLGEAKRVAQAVKLTDLLTQLEQQEAPLPPTNPLLVPRADSPRGTPVPVKP